MTVDELREKIANLSGDTRLFTYNDGYVPVTDLVATSPDSGGGYVFV